MYNDIYIYIWIHVYIHSAWYETWKFSGQLVASCGFVNKKASLEPRFLQNLHTLNPAQRPIPWRNVAPWCRAPVAQVPLHHRWSHWWFPTASHFLGRVAQCGSTTNRVWYFMNFPILKVFLTVEKGDLLWSKRPSDSWSPVAHDWQISSAGV